MKISLHLSIIFIILLAGFAAEYNVTTANGEVIAISSSRETAVGRSISKKVEEKMELDEDALLQEKINDIGQKLAAACDRRDIIYSFKVLAEDRVNAFALPGGYIYVFKGMLDKVESDDEIAAILAHEIGHINAKHHAKRAQRGLTTELLRILIIRGAEDPESKIRANVAINELLLSYSREDEIEADRLAIKYVEKAGYKPEAVISMVEKLLKLKMEGPIMPKIYYRTHPYLTDRIRAAREEIYGQIRFIDYANTPTKGVE